MTTYSHRSKQTNPLNGVMYLMLCIAFATAMLKLGINNVKVGITTDCILGLVFFIVAALIYGIAAMIFFDLFKYFKSN